MLSTILQAITLGIIQGLTEFIPVSSSGHLQILPLVFGWAQPSTVLILFAHMGTLAALVFFYRKRLWQYAKVVWGKVTKQKMSHTDNNDLSLIVKVLIAALPAGILGAVLDSRISQFYDNGDPKVAALITLVAMGVLGVVFLFIDKLVTTKHDLTKLAYPKAVIIGLSQALAFIRGTSRSGITIVTSRLVGLSRVDAAEFSFLISIPIIFGTSVLGIYDLTKMSGNEIATFLPTAIITAVTSFIFGFFAIKFLLNYLKKHNLSIFGWYRIIFVIVIAVILFS